MRILLIALLCATPLCGEVIWLKDKTPPDHAILEKYRTGELHELQKTLADAYAALAKEWEDSPREQANACRRAMLAFPGHEGANEVYAALPDLPESRKDWKASEPDSKYVTALRVMQSEHLDNYVSLADAFADAGLPLAHQFAVTEARHAAGTFKRAHKKLDEALPEIAKKMTAHPLRMSSYNLLYPGGTDVNDKDPENWRWEKRRHLHDEVLRMMQADVIGWQETSSWMDVLGESWDEYYDYYDLTDFTGNPKGRDRDCGIYFLKGRFEVVEMGYRHLNRHNDIGNKKGDWGSSQSRQIGWLRLKDNYSGLQFYFFNTHLSYFGESYVGDDGTKGTTDDLHEYQMGPCMQEIDKACPLLPAFFTGDFNNRGGNPWRMAVEEGPFHADHSYRDAAFGIDWILGTEHLKMPWAYTLYAKKDNIRASDHLTCLAYYELPDVEGARTAWEETRSEEDEVGDKALLETYVRLLIMTDPAAAIELLDDQLDELDKGQRDGLMWLFGQAQEYFGEPEDAVKTYKKLGKETEDTDTEHRCTWRGFAVLVWRGLAKRGDLKALERYAEDKDTPPLWADRATALLEQAK